MNDGTMERPVMQENECQHVARFRGMSAKGPPKPERWDWFRISASAWIAVFVPLGGTFVCSLRAADAAEWPAPVPGWQKPAPGEHPRLFLRKKDLAEIKKRAETPEGKAIVARLRVLLNGTDGKSLPAVFNDSKEHSDRDRKSIPAGDGKGFTMTHAAGYGMLYQLTGDKLYANLGQQSVQKMLDGMRDCDGRYSWINANGALRAGPALGAMAMAYDLNYGGWDEEFRLKVAKALETGPSGEQAFSTEYLVNGRRKGPNSNHWGGQIGGGSVAGHASGVEIAGQDLHFIAVGGKLPELEHDGNEVTVGGQTVSFDGQKISFAKIAGPPKQKRLGWW